MRYDFAVPILARLRYDLIAKDMEAKHEIANLMDAQLAVNGG
jgi:hypothetical protein